ncbi:MAG: Ig-like domain-containing protein, partial [Gemmatimonadota bacterium]|nr:Ig-like domain-containing protein [Gemmatimonadota bacterium]
MSRRIVPVVVAVAVLAACKGSESPISHAPTTLAIVSGSNQTGDPSKALAAPLVVRATDAAGRVVSGVAIGWAVTGGGSVSPPTATTDAQGQASGTWTLGPTPGTQTATATGSAMSGAAAAFVAGNGPTIAGTVSIANPDPTSFFSAQRAPARSRAPRASVAPRYSSGGLVVTFHGAPFHAAAAGSPAYRSLAVAQSTAAALQQRVAALTVGLAVGRVRVSPAILAAHVALTDSTKVAQVMAVLRADPSVASVTRDLIYTIRDGAPAPQAVRFVPFRGAAVGSARPAGAATA